MNIISKESQEELDIKSIIHFGFIIVLVIFGTILYYQWMNQDCDTNPPQHCYYTSNNIIDNNYTDCKTTQYEVDNLIFPDVPRKISCLYNGERIEVEFKETGYKCATSNATKDYRRCK